MGFFDDLAGKVPEPVKGSPGQQGSGRSDGPVDEQGDSVDSMQAFNQQGLGDIISSRVGKGNNLPDQPGTGPRGPG